MKETLWEAIEKHGSYDIIYLDIEMENMDGITVARKIREQDPYTILLFVSSYDSYYEQLFEVEPLRFLRKPINPEKFEEYFKIIPDPISVDHVYGKSEASDPSDRKRRTGVSLLYENE